MIKDLNSYLTDQEFFTYVKFLNLIIDKNYENLDGHELGIRDLSIGSESVYQTFKRAFDFLDLVDPSVKIESYNFKETEVRFEISNRPKNEQINLNKIIDKILKDKSIKFSDVGALSWVWHEVYSATRFTPDTYTIPHTVREKIVNNINQYLDNLINNKLAIVKKNYYKFEILKQTLIQIIEEDKMIPLYGMNFIIRKGIDENGNVKSLPDFCIIQTVYALERLGYLKVVKVWEDIKYKSEYITSDEKDKTRFICVNIILEDMFIKEIYNKYKKENPKNIIESFDEAKGILKFAGETIELSSKGKETDASLLMKAVLKKADDDWMHNDEIFQVWGFNEKDIKNAAKNKIYFAAQKVNNNVAIKTGIEDFLDFTTTKARINPRYKKVDE